MSAPRPSEALCGDPTPHVAHPMPCDSGCQPDWHRDSCAIYGTCPGLHVPAAPRSSEADEVAFVVCPDLEHTTHNGHDHCEQVTQRLVDWLDARDAEHEREVAALRRWKAEASSLFDSLQDLGRALELPLGALITGPAAVEAASVLTDRAEAAERALADLRGEIEAALSLLDEECEPDLDDYEHRAQRVYKVLASALLPRDEAAGAGGAG